MLPVANTMPSPRMMMPPAVPMRLMTAFALERSGLIVTSGISATAGERNVAIASSAISRMPMNTISGVGLACVRCQA